LFWIVWFFLLGWLAETRTRRIIGTGLSMRAVLSWWWFMVVWRGSSKVRGFRVRRGWHQLELRIHQLGLMVLFVAFVRSRWFNYYREPTSIHTNYFGDVLSGMLGFMLVIDTWGWVGVVFYFMVLNCFCLIAGS